MNLSEITESIESHWGRFVGEGFSSTGAPLDGDVVILDLKESFCFLGILGGDQHKLTRFTDWCSDVVAHDGAATPQVYANDGLREFFVGNGSNRRLVTDYIRDYTSHFFPGREEIFDRFGSAPDWFADTQSYYDELGHPLEEFEHQMTRHVAQIIWGELVGLAPGFDRIRQIILAGGIPIGSIEEEFDSEEGWWEQELAVCWVHDDPPPTPWETD